MTKVLKVPMTALLGGLLALTACSSSSNDDSDGSVPGGDTMVSDTQVTPDAAVTGGVGDTCDKDDACLDGICFDSTCKKPCTKDEECDPGDECTTDDDKRTFCNTPAYSADIGTSCAITGTCPVSTMQCLGSKDSAAAYCSAKCTTSADCPQDFYCREVSDTESYCMKRSFCTRCFTDAQCGDGSVCVKQGDESFCTYACNAGSTECPRYAECKDTGNGTYACMHKSGTCAGDGSQCQPCIASSDCVSGGRCLTFTYTKESFCAESCASQSCTGEGTDFDCTDIPLSASSSAKLCIPHMDQGSTDLPGCVPQLSPMGEVGDVMQDFAMVGYHDTDKDGSLVGEKLRVVKLSDYAKDPAVKVILFNVSAGWCGPCQSETKTFGALMDKYGPQGLMIFQTLFDSDKKGVRPTVPLLDAWVKAFAPKGVVGIDPARNSPQYNTGGTTPLNMLIDAATMKVVDKFNGYSQGAAESKIAAALGIKP